MNRTGICQKVLFAAALGLLLGMAGSAQAVEYDPNLPRIEEVRDVDGSIWKVLITPRPLYRPQNMCVPCLPAASPHMAPPLPAPSIEPGKTKQAPADAEKKPEEQAALLSHKTALISLQAAEDKADTEKAEEPAKEEAAKDNPFGVEIVPRFSYPILPPSAACCPAESSTIPVDPMCYAWIYDNIPFMRSEYVANPSYRHDATMEILLGQLRPAVAPKPVPQPRPHETLFPFENDIIRPYSYYSQGPGGAYGRGPLPGGAPGAYGVNYNFYYPMPTVYRNY